MLEIDTRGNRVILLLLYLAKKLQCNEKSFSKMIETTNLKESKERYVGWFEGRKYDEMMSLTQEIITKKKFQSFTTDWKKEELVPILYKLSENTGRTVSLTHIIKVA